MERARAEAARARSGGRRAIAPGRCAPSTPRSPRSPRRPRARASPATSTPTRPCATRPSAASRRWTRSSTELSLDRGLYDALAALDVSGEDAATRHLVEKSLRDFRRAGVDRDEATRARVRALREELVRIGQEFGRNIKDDVRSVELDPARPRRAARGLAPRPPARRGRQGDGHDRQHRLRALHDLRAERRGARGAVAALPAARPPAEPRRALADARAARRAGARCSATRPGPPTSPRTR